MKARLNAYLIIGLLVSFVAGCGSIVPQNGMDGPSQSGAPVAPIVSQSPPMDATQKSASDKGANQPDSMKPVDNKLTRTVIFPEVTGNFHGIAFDENGNMYVGKDGKEILKISPDGQSSLFAEVKSEVLLNLAMGGDGCLYAVAKTKVFKIKDDGNAELILNEKDFSNEFGGHNIIFDSAGNMYIPYLNTVYKYSPSLERSVFFDGSAGDIKFSLIAGMAFDNEEKNFYISDPRQEIVVRFAINSDGSLGSNEVFKKISNAEYIAVDNDDNAYIGDYTGTFLTRISKDSKVQEFSLSGYYDCNTIVLRSDGMGSQAIYGTSHGGKLFKIDVQRNMEDDGDK